MDQFDRLNADRVFVTTCLSSSGRMKTRGGPGSLIVFNTGRTEGPAPQVAACTGFVPGCARGQ
jgi:hypothetical protein